MGVYLGCWQLVKIICQIKIYLKKIRNCIEIETRLKVVCASVGGRNAKFFVRCTTRYPKENYLKVSA